MLRGFELYNNVKRKIIFKSRVIIFHPLHRKTYEASLVAAGTGARSQPCIVTGYPVLGNRSEYLIEYCDFFYRTNLDDLVWKTSGLSPRAPLLTSQLFGLAGYSLTLHACRNDVGSLKVS